MSATPAIDVDAAEGFVRREARLLDLRRFERAFAARPGGDGAAVPTDPDDGEHRAAVLAALLAYANPDGGFAGILEPDLRTTRSQPQAAELALRVLDELGRHPRIDGPADAAVVALCDWLRTITGPDGGLPFTHPSARGHPAAPHWHEADGRSSSLNPTAAIVGLLHRRGVEHPWLDAARACCWRLLGVGEQTDQPAEALDLYSVRAALWLLDPAVPDPPDPEALRERLAQGVADHIALDPALTEPGAPGHHIGPLEIAPWPTDPGRALLPPAAVEAALDALAARQRPDGGWPVNFAPISAAATAEWRGWATVHALLVLRAAGRLAD